MNAIAIYLISLLISQASAAAQGWVEARTPEDARSYSSVWNNDPVGTGHARSMLDSEQAWSAGHLDTHQWLQLDLGSVKRVSGTVIQGRADGHDQWVSQYTVDYSDSGSTWTRIEGDFTGVGTLDVRSRNLFPEVVLARYLRLNVVAWSMHISMRADALLPADPPDPIPNPDSCVYASVGASVEETVTVTIAQDFYCPRRVDSSNWKGEVEAEAGVWFKVQQNVRTLTVTRMDAVAGWDFNLQFLCCTVNCAHTVKSIAGQCGATPQVLSSYNNGLVSWVPDGTLIDVPARTDLALAICNTANVDMYNDQSLFYQQLVPTIIRSVGAEARVRIDVVNSGNVNLYGTLQIGQLLDDSMDDIEYVGCFWDDAHGWNGVGPQFNFGPQAFGYTMESCDKACVMYSLFSLSSGGWCSCGNTRGTSPPYVQIDQSDCDRQLPTASEVYARDSADSALIASLVYGDFGERAEISVNIVDSGNIRLMRPSSTLHVTNGNLVSELVNQQVGSGDLRDTCVELRAANTANVHSDAGWGTVNIIDGQLEDEGLDLAMQGSTRLSVTKVNTACVTCDKLSIEDGELSDEMFDAGLNGSLSVSSVAIQLKGVGNVKANWVNITEGELIDELLDIGESLYDSDIVVEMSNCGNLEASELHITEGELVDELVDVGRDIRGCNVHLTVDDSANGYTHQAYLVGSELLDEGVDVGNAAINSHFQYDVTNVANMRTDGRTGAILHMIQDSQLLDDLFDAVEVSGSSLFISASDSGNARCETAGANQLFLLTSRLVDTPVNVDQPLIESQTALRLDNCANAYATSSNLVMDHQSELLAASTAAPLVEQILRSGERRDHCD